MKTSTLLALQAATAVQAAVQAVGPTELKPAPWGISFEFGAVDEFFPVEGARDVKHSAWAITPHCLNSIRRSSEYIHIRVGGQTQDLAGFDEESQKFGDQAY